MKVWVTGAYGLLGKAVCARLAAENIPVIATDQDLDIRDYGAVEWFAGETVFTHVINCAAFTQVDQCEAKEDHAMHVNADGAAHVARAANRRGAIALQVSTDYVFDGSGTEPYREDAPCAPINAYGRTKLAGERRFTEEGGHYIVRTSWLFGSGGASFVATMLRLMTDGAEIRVVDDQCGRPTYSVDLAAALVGLLQRAPDAGTYHFANSGAVTWCGFASAIRELARRNAKIIPITTADYPTAAQRPAWSVLSTERIERVLAAPPRPWRDALAAHLETL